MYLISFIQLYLSVSIKPLMQIKDAYHNYVIGEKMYITVHHIFIMFTNVNSSFHRFSHVMTMKPTSPEARFYYATSVILNKTVKKEAEAIYYANSSLIYFFIYLFQEADTLESSEPTLGG